VADASATGLAAWAACCAVHAGPLKPVLHTHLRWRLLYVALPVQTATQSPDELDFVNPLLHTHSVPVSTALVPHAVLVQFPNSSKSQNPFGSQTQ
jgi:hypothetical protein